MANKSLIIKPVAATVGLAFVSSVAIADVDAAADNPFDATDLDAGYLLAGDDKDEEGKCGEGKCGDEEGGEDDDKGEEGKCGEGKCGGAA